jgi:hypothetical protein
VHVLPQISNFIIEIETATITYVSTLVATESVIMESDRSDVTATMQSSTKRFGFLPTKTCHPDVVQFI